MTTKRDDVGTDPAFRETLVRRIIDAWTIEGRAPYYHRKQKELLRRNWRPLANAIDELVNSWPALTPSPALPKVFYMSGPRRSAADPRSYIIRSEGEPHYLVRVLPVGLQTKIICDCEAAKTTAVCDHVETVAIVDRRRFGGQDDNKEN